jgi:hypothetical protein
MATIATFYCPLCSFHFHETTLVGKRWQSMVQPCPGCGARIRLNEEVVGLSWHEPVFAYIAPRLFPVTALCLFGLLNLGSGGFTVGRSIASLLIILVVGRIPNFLASMFASFAVRALIAHRVAKRGSAPRFCARFVVDENKFFQFP